MNIITRGMESHHRLFPGQGRLNLKGLLDAVISGSGYTGILTLETSNEDCKVVVPKRIAMDGRRSILRLLSLVYDSYHAVSIPERMDIDTPEDDMVMASHLSSPGYVVLPPIGTVYGFEFIEFVVNGVKLEALGHWLELIGFKRVGKHRHKNVFLYRSGQASILLNSDPTMFGASLFSRRGVTIYVVGVRVSDVSTILDRARCLNYPTVPISRQTNPAEFFWAVQAPNETLMVLVQDSDWKRDYDFETFPDIPGNDNSIVHIEGASFSVIDHLALALDRVTLDAFCVFYQSMFGMNYHNRCEQNDIYAISKFQEYVSCPSSLPWQEDPCPIKGGLRFPIGTFDNRDTTIGNLVLAVGGSIIHHVAFATDDIFTLAERIKKTSSHKHTILPVPSHYYDKLGSKYEGLSTEFIMQMKEYDILYDRIGNGEFLTMNTELFEERFFLEICERRNGYSSFGLAHSEIWASATLPAEIPGSEWKEKHNQEITGSFPRLRERRFLIVVVVDGEGLVYWLQQTSDALGCEYRVIECWYDLHHIEEQATSTLVVGINEEVFLHHFVEHWGAPLSAVSEASSQKAMENCGVKRILIRHVCVEAETASYERISTICDFEFYYSKLKYNRREYARFLTFALQLTYPHPHDEIVTKERSFVLMLPFQNIAKVVDMIEIFTVGVDAVELRVDMLQEQSGGDSGFPSIRYVGEQVMWLRQSTELPIVFTIRSTPQRGNIPLENPGIVYQYLLKALQWGCEYLDVEVQLPEQLRSQLYSRRGMARILSTYCTTTTNKYLWMSTESEKIYEACNRYADIVRIFGFAETLSDNFELETFRSKVTKTHNVRLPLMAINMGQWGQMSRLLNTFMTPVTHPLMASLTLPGQMTVAELNAGLHIIGKLPKRDLYSFRLVSRHNLNTPVTTGGIPSIFDNYGATFASRSEFNMSNTAFILPSPANSVFAEKCIKELNLPIKLTNLGVSPDQADNYLQLLFQSPSFGSLTFPIPFPIPSYLPYITPSARAIGTIDAISEQFSDSQRLLIGDNCLWKAIRKILHRDFSAEAYRGKPGLILSRSESDAAAALYALCTTGVSKIYTIGFGVRCKPGHKVFDMPGGEIEIIRLKSPNDLRTKTQPFVVISVLSTERTNSVIPLLGMISEVCEAKQLSRLLAGRVFVEVIPGFGGLAPSAAGSGGVTSGVAQAARRANWPFVYEPVDVQAILITEKMKFMLGQNMSWGFMRMTAQGFY